MSKHHPSEWWTTTLLAEHGPTDRAEYDVLVALVSWRADRRVVTRSFPELARRARMSEAATKAAVKRLERSGLLSVVRPLAYGRKLANGYVVNREPLVAAACDATGWAPMLDLDDLGERGTETYPFDENAGDERGTKTTPFIPERGTSLTIKGYETDPPVVIGVQGRGVRAVAEAARNAPAARVEPTSPPLPETDENGKPQRPADPVRSCLDHDSWSGTHTCWTCAADKQRDRDYRAALDNYRRELDAWEHLTTKAADDAARVERDAAEARALAADRAEFAALPLCGHGIRGGNTPADAHSTVARCDQCEPAMLVAHAVAGGCDDPACPSGPNMVEASVFAAARARSHARERVGAADAAPVVPRRRRTG